MGRSAFAHQWEWQWSLAVASALCRQSHWTSPPSSIYGKPASLGSTLPVPTRLPLSFCSSHWPPHSQDPTIFQMASWTRPALGVLWQLTIQSVQCIMFPVQSSVQSPPYPGLTKNQCGLQWNLVLPGWDSVRGFSASGAILAVTLLSTEPVSSFPVSWCS